MTPRLFEKNATSFTGLGLRNLTDAISCTVTEERNGIYELEMVYPISGAGFGEITEDRIILAKAHEQGNPQAFRIYRIDKVLSGQATINARHISYQLAFTPVSALSGTGNAQAAMNALKSAALDSCPFTFASDIAGIKSYNISVPSAIRTALGGMEGSILDTYGGEFEWDNWDVILHESRGSDKGARIAYGKNLTGLDRAVDIGGTITGVMAYYIREDGSIVYSYPKVIQNDHVSDFAHGRTVALDVSGEFETEPTAAQITAYATSYLATTALAEASEALTVDFVPLWQTTEYGAPYVEHIELCDIVTVEYKKLGVTVKKKVTKTVFNVLSNRYDSIELGGEATVVDTLAGLATDTSSLSSASSRMEQEIAQLSAKVAAMYSVDTVSLPIASVPANSGSGSDNTASATKTGYTPLGILGFNVTSSGLMPFRLYMTSGTIRGRFRNITNSAISSTATIYVLYAKN